MTLTPNPKFVTKQLMTLVTVTILIVVFGAIMVKYFPYLDEEIDPESFGRVTWIVFYAMIAALWVVAVPSIILWYRNLSYYIEEDKVIIHKGVLGKVQQNIPYRMVTDFRLVRSPYDRILGIGSVQIQTAGQSGNGTGYEGKLEAMIDWEGVHQELRHRLADYRGGLADAGRADSADRSSGNEAETLQLILNEIREMRKDLKER